MESLDLEHKKEKSSEAQTITQHEGKNSRKGEIALSTTQSPTQTKPTTKQPSKDSSSERFKNTAEIKSTFGDTKEPTKMAAIPRDQKQPTASKEGISDDMERQIEKAKAEIQQVSNRCYC